MSSAAVNGCLTLRPPCHSLPRSARAADRVTLANAGPWQRKLRIYGARGARSEAVVRGPSHSHAMNCGRADAMVVWLAPAVADHRWPAPGPQQRRPQLAFWLECSQRHAEEHGNGAGPAGAHPERALVRPGPHLEWAARPKPSR